jgi:hypothetical protein
MTRVPAADGKGREVALKLPTLPKEPEMAKTGKPNILIPMAARCY